MDCMARLSGPVVLGSGQIFVLLELPAKMNNQILEKNKQKALDNNNQVTNFFANRKERKYIFIVVSELLMEFLKAFVVGSFCEH